jgi:hypothetical protein
LSYKLVIWSSWPHLKRVAQVTLPRWIKRHEELVNNIKQIIRNDLGVKVEPQLFNDYFINLTRGESYFSFHPCWNLKCPSLDSNVTRCLSRGVVSNLTATATLRVREDIIRQLNMASQGGNIEECCLNKPKVQTCLPAFGDCSGIGRHVFMTLSYLLIYKESKLSKATFSCSRQSLGTLCRIATPGLRANELMCFPPKLILP